MASRRTTASMRRPRSRSGRRRCAAAAMPPAKSLSERVTDSGAACTAAVTEALDMEETSGERERIEPRGALSRPRRLKPVPAALCLSLGIEVARELPNRESPAEAGLSGEWTARNGTAEAARGSALFGGYGLRLRTIRGGI